MNAPRFGINKEGWVTQKPYDIFTLVLTELEPDVADAPMVCALRDPWVVSHMAKISGLVADIAESLSYEQQVELARKRGYKEVE